MIGQLHSVVIDAPDAHALAGFYACGAQTGGATGPRVALHAAAAPASGGGASAAVGGGVQLASPSSSSASAPSSSSSLA